MRGPAPRLRSVRRRSDPITQRREGPRMIVIGADTHKRSHTAAAVDAATGRLLGEQTIAARRRSFDALLIWARGHGGDRVWAIEDWRHVSGALERFLLAGGEAVVGVAPKLTAGARSAARAGQVRRHRRSASAGRTASPGAWRAPSRAPASGSHVTNCAASA